MVNNTINNSINEIMIDDIVLFIHIVKSQGLAGAAKQLKIPAATVTRRLKKLEGKVGCQLIHRSARQFRLTAEGLVYFESFADLVERFESVSKELSFEANSLEGSLTVLAPTNISIGYLQPMWSQFIGDHPEIQLNLKLNNDNKDMVEEHADIALRIGPQRDSSLYQIKVGSIPSVLVASHNYLAQSAPLNSLEDLKHHKCITVSHMPTWKFQHTKSKLKQTINPEASLKVNDISIASKFAKDGHGIALLPPSEVLEYLHCEQLFMPLPDWQGPARDIFLIWPSGKLLSAKAKCLKEHIQRYMKVALNELAC